MKIKRIDSATNSIYKDLLLLHDSKGIHKQKKALVFGEKIIKENISSFNDSDFFIFNSEFHTLFDLKPQSQVLVLPKELFKNLDVIGTNSPILCTTIDSFKNWEPPESSPQDHEVLCALSDPNNVGAVIRSAFAFGIRKMILLKECANPFLPKVTKAASGYNFKMSFEKGPSIKELQNTSHLAALHMEGTHLEDWDFQKPMRWLMGEEGQGLPQTINCSKITIPMENNVESLNAAVSASILFYTLKLKKRL